ncbi:cardiolipin synthase 2 [Geobacter sp. OR-1]|uniref:phospholipase D-like domain-containing protein n=1 Tax=Geobacter sp. OR-1 TaxID=1266765 RepID=UPI0005425239|nr:cardiolipin synthase 2 [Geobacter sp. OR-1]
MSLIRLRKKRNSSRARRFFGRFRRSTEATVTHGNLVKLLPNGGEFFSALFAALRSARQSINLEFYIIRDDATGRELAAILADAVRRGVRVSIIYDYIGCFDTPASYFRNLEQAGVACLPFNPPPFKRGLAWFDKRDHRKIAIIDGVNAFAGGLNVGSEYAGYGEDRKRWRDVGLSVKGSGAVELQRLFFETWQAEAGIDPDSLYLDSGNASDRKGDATIHIVSGGPHHNRSHIHNAFRLAIGRARKCITVANPYFIPGPRVIRSLMRAARRNVRVRLILPAINDVPLVGLVSRSSYATLLKGGIEIYERQETVLHAKVMLIDSRWSIIGSANLDHRSFHRNYEVNLIVDSQTFGAQVEEMLARDLEMSRRILLDEHEKTGVARTVAGTSCRADQLVSLIITLIPDIYLIIYRWLF